MEVHAHLLAQQLDGRMRPAVPAWSLWLAALAVVAAGGLTSLLELRGWKLALVLAAQLVLIAGLPFAAPGLAASTRSACPPSAGALGWAFAFAAVGTAARAVGSEQSHFAQATLGKYLPADVAAEILKDPDQLALNGEKRPIYALFTDLEGFTKLSHAITPEHLSGLLNRYLDMLSDVVLDHGGTIDKFVGDAVVAFWGAPIARDDDADRAVRAAVAMYEARRGIPPQPPAPDIPPIGCTRVGLHHGEAVVGNFGGEGRIQYTALGDAHEHRLAARNRPTSRSRPTILVSAEAKAEIEPRHLPPDGPDRAERPRDPGRGLGAGARHAGGRAAAADRALAALRQRATPRALADARGDRRRARRMRRSPISCIVSARQVREVILSWGPNKTPSRAR